MLKIKKIVYRLISKDFYLCFISRIHLYFLYKIFRFNKWHVNGTYYCRKYKKILVNEINKLNLNNAVEIGGGVGDIVSRLNTSKKFLIDVDNNLKNVVNFLYKDVIFINGSFESIKQIDNENIDILILVNWIHELKQDYIITQIKNILKFKNIKYILVDEINLNIEGYKYKHNFENAIEGFKTLKLIEDPENIRKFRILEWKQNT